MQQTQFKIIDSTSTHHKLKTSRPSNLKHKHYKFQTQTHEIKIQFLQTTHTAKCIPNIKQYANQQLNIQFQT